MSETGWDFTRRILHSAEDLCLVLNASVNAYRRLDPNYEAPNEIAASAIDRSSMIRIPCAGKAGQRIEVRSVGPDANPYLLIYSLLRTGLEGPQPDPNAPKPKRVRKRLLPGNIYDAMTSYRRSGWVKELMGEVSHAKYHELKEACAHRCPRELGDRIKRAEIMFHHEVTNQMLWSTVLGQQGRRRRPGRGSETPPRPPVTWHLYSSRNLYYNMGCSTVMSTEVAVPGGLSSFHCWSCRTVKAFIRFVVAALGLALLLTGGLARSQTPLLPRRLCRPRPARLHWSTLPIPEHPEVLLAHAHLLHEPIEGARIHARQLRRLPDPPAGGGQHLAQVGAQELRVHRLARLAQGAAAPGGGEDARTCRPAVVGRDQGRRAGPAHGPRQILAPDLAPEAAAPPARSR